REGVLGLDPLDEPGRADITAHVNFSALERAASDAGFEPQRLVSQRELLLSIGVRGVSRYLREARASAEAEGRHADALALLAERSRVETLAAPGGLGDLLVLIAGKEAPRLELSPGGSRVKESQ
ncbi:MAG: SAM-dependent methyltransferase, partial [Actinomycetota bacterium]